MEPLAAGFLKGHDNVEFGGDIKLRSNGSRRLPQAVPNPYSNSELTKYSVPMLHGLHVLFDTKCLRLVCNQNLMILVYLSV